MRDRDQFDPSILRLGTLLLLFDVYLTWARIEKQESSISSGTGSTGGSNLGALAQQPIVFQYLFFLILCTFSTLAFHLSIRFLTSSPASPLSLLKLLPTYTHTMTICGAPGVMNCPATYQTKVVVTRTTTPTEVIVIVLTPLPTPVTATFVAPTVTETTTVHVDDYVEATEGLETTVATTTATTTITSIASHGVLPTPPVIAVPSPNADVGVDTGADVDVSVPANATVVGTGVVPRPTQSGPKTPVIAGAPALGSAHGVYVGAAMTFVAALFMGAL
ncbi:hypothetical protein NUW58_g6918 [Xylaria curta]|uniref:Uncharacterized protein n=1 Tax=Xylaria curta TaxID=42375 RepID=A0ACC1NNR9_9PEZI|nr:hypothetical protein NUW58_g6918 [Xylaria curta]